MEREQNLVDRLEAMLRGGGYEVHREVRLLTRYIDLVARAPHGGTVLAVEAKVRNWREGLRQALVYRLAADRVFLAVSSQYAHRVNHDLLRSYGIGLITVDGQAHIVMSAGDSEVIHKSLREQLMSEISRRKEV
ncbi:MAG: hypothetical protein ACE5IJ_05395 [Thermoplasmata archaeon]